MVSEFRNSELEPNNWAESQSSGEPFSSHNSLLTGKGREFASLSGLRECWNDLYLQHSTELST
jgi:hypothetical protein